VAFIPIACGSTYVLPEGAAPTLPPPAAVARQPEEPAFIDRVVAGEAITRHAWYLVCGASLASRIAAERETVAFNDVAAAFRAYLQRDNHGRPFVLMGHSQGSFMAERLLTSVILPDAALRAKLIVALLLGGSVQVPIGTTTNGTLGAFPLCTSDEQTGCALAWHTFGLDHGPTPGGVYPVSFLPGDEAACTNPVGLAHGATDTRVRAVYLPTFAYQALFSVGVAFTPAVTTPFVVYRDFYSLGCTANASFRFYLALHAQPAVGDMRTDPIPYGGLLFAPSFLGLHLLDYNVAIEDLMALVARKAARFANAS
jgi:hypothetical protein